MKCHNCGSDIPEESVFCGMCGTRLEPEKAETMPNAGTEPIIPEPVTDPEPTPAEPVIDPLTEPTEPTSEPVEPTAESVEPTAKQVESTVESVELTSESADPITESFESITESAEPMAESVQPVGEQVVAESESDDSKNAQADEFILNHCPNCGAVVINGAKFCSNCGYSVVVHEKNMRAEKIGAKTVIAAILAACVIIFGVYYLVGCRSIEGEWAVENSGGGIFSMFSESYLDFKDDGTAMYYNGFFNARRYSYTYNRFTKILTLKSTGYGADDEDTCLHVEWIDPHTVSIRELNMTLYRIDDIPYAYEDDEFSDEDVVEF